MSGPLLLGIAAVGVGWAFIHRNDGTKPATDIAAAATAAAGNAADAATADAEVTTGLGSVQAAVENCSDASTIGTNVAGTTGGQVLPVDYCAVEASVMTVDPKKSLGGADPSSMDSGLDRYMSPPIIAQSGDSLDAVMTIRYGSAGANGMTKQQIGNAYRESAPWSNEVF